MSEAPPETPTNAARAYILAFSFASGFEAVVMIWDGRIIPAIASAAVGAIIAFIDYKLKPILAWLGPQFTARLNQTTADPRWWIGTAMLFLVLIALSPYLEERRWPYVWQTAAPAAPSGFTQQQVDEKVSAATKPLLETISGLQQQQQPNAGLQAQLDGANNQITDLRRQLQRMEDFEKGVFKPFPDGQIQIRKLIHKEAEDLIGHLNDVTDFARTANNIPSILDLVPFNRPDIPQQPRYPQSLEKPGIPAAIVRLKEFQAAIIAFRDGINGKINAEPKYAGDISYIVGTTNADNLLTAASTYTYRLELIDKDNSKHPDYPLNLQIITFVVGDSAMQTQKALMHFWQWSNEFVNQRSGLARQEINKYL